MQFVIGDIRAKMGIIDVSVPLSLWAATADRAFKSEIGTVEAT